MTALKDQPDQTRRSMFRGLPLAAVAAAIPSMAGDIRTANERVEFHIAELQKALADLAIGPLEVRLQSDQGAVIDTVAGAPMNKGVPRTLWRVQA
ncbi:MAG TPA: hypothetical protein VIL30_14530 [Ramlibacter sp.]|jgi:ABC-type Na+ efflux pump permease subunit